MPENSFEQELKAYFKNHNYAYVDNSAEFKLLDFTLLDFITEVRENAKVNRKFYLEVKEKRQVYNTKNWDIIRPEEEVHMFIMDELSARKILAYAPFSGLLVRNNLTSMYHWFSIMDMYLMPKIRVDRPIQKHDTISYKGKWIMDLRNSKAFTNLALAFDEIRGHVLNREHLYTGVNECYGRYVNEQIHKQGIVRNPGHWDTDVAETR